MDPIRAVFAFATVMILRAWAGQRHAHDDRASEGF